MDLKNENNTTMDTTKIYPHYVNAKLPNVKLEGLYGTPYMLSGNTIILDDCIKQNGGPVPGSSAVTLDIFPGPCSKPGDAFIFLTRPQVEQLRERLGSWLITGRFE